jgi:PBP1b-binding outer membrane lipoprotein LpoB
MNNKLRIGIIVAVVIVTVATFAGCVEEETPQNFEEETPQTLEEVFPFLRGCPANQS